MNAERIEKLRERARLTLDSIDDFEEPELWLFYTDVLSLLDEKAEQLKAGDKSLMKLAQDLDVPFSVAKILYDKGGQDTIEYICRQDSRG